MKENKATGSSCDDVKKSTRRDFLTKAAGLGLAAAGMAATTASPAAAESHADPMFKGKTAFVTGGARGIGLGCAVELAKEGADVVLYDIAGPIKTVQYPLATNEDLAAAKSTIEGFGVKCLTVKGDVRDRTGLDAAMAKTVSTFGSLDFLVANAGITHTGDLAAFTDEEVQVVVDINLGGVIKTVQAVMPIMRKQKSGRIILMSSVTGRAGNDSFPIYSSTKWGVIGLAKSTALIMGKHGVTCNAVCPTLVRTKLLDNEYVLKSLFPDNPKFEVFETAAKAFDPMGVGFYDPIQVGQTVKFLCSEDSAITSGDVFDIGAGVNANFNA